MNREAGNPHACASCKHQRKRCDETCELAPYFPANRYREFQNAHRLFGVSNIIKIINSVEPHQRQPAAESILMEGNARRNDPAHGCLGIVRKLQAEIEYYEKQLDFVNQQRAVYREREKMQQQKQQLENFLTSSSLGLLPPQQDRFDVLPDLPIMGDMKSSDHGFNYQSTLEEGADVKPFDIQPIDQMMDSYQHEHSLTSFNVPGESSAVSKATGKQPLECDGEEETGNHEAGSSAKGKECNDIKERKS